MKDPADDALARKKTGTTDVGIQRHTPLTETVLRSDYASMRQLVFLGADPNAFDDYRMTPLLWAIMRRYIDVVKLLWERGADPNVKPNPSDSFGMRFRIVRASDYPRDKGFGSRELMRLAFARRLEQPRAVSSTRGLSPAFNKSLSAWRLDCCLLSPPRLLFGCSHEIRACSIGVHTVSRHWCSRQQHFAPVTSPRGERCGLTLLSR